MKTIIKLLVATTALVFALVAVVFLTESDTDVTNLDADLTSIREQIKLAEETSAQFTGGLVKSYADLRAETHRLSESMLMAKRASLLHRISLTYHVDGRAIVPAKPEELVELEQEIKGLREKLKAAEENAARYTGGLVQSMALVQVETARMAEAQLLLVWYSRKHGLTFPKPSKDAEAPPRPGQNITRDRDAL
ncbi:MAG: hypothetical protein K2Y29_11405 [Beijerinckiaceae bacterium]|nr:hypothetical protein [Beijerinckiaceae bacterium]